MPHVPVAGPGASKCQTLPLLMQLQQITIISDAYQFYSVEQAQITITAINSCNF